LSLRTLSVTGPLVDADICILKQNSDSRALHSLLEDYSPPLNRKQVNILAIWCNAVFFNLSGCGSELNE